MTATAASPLLVEDLGPIRVLTLNRPEVRNAVDAALARAIASAIDGFEADPALRVGVLAACGPVFCAGMDLRAFLRGERPEVPERGFAGLVRKPPRKPLIAAVQGPAVAGGFELALACDLVVAAHTATFALPEVRRGLVAAGGGLLRLPRRLPYHRAMELALTGGSLAAREAYALGLVNRVVPADEVRAAALELAMAIAGNGPLAVLATKQILVESPEWAADEAFTLQSALTEPVRSSADAREGAQAFTEKRPPVWTGR